MDDSLTLKQICSEIIQKLNAYSASLSLTKHVEKEPVSNVALFDNGVYDLSPDEPEPDVEEIGPHLGADDNNEPVHDHQKAKHC